MKSRKDWEFDNIEKGLIIYAIGFIIGSILAVL